METIIKGLNLALDGINSLTPQSWYLIGVILGSICATIGVTAWVKRHHLKQTGEKLASEFIVLNVGFWGMLSTVATFVITQGTNFGPFLPFLSDHWAQISGGAIAVHAVSTALYSWWQDRKAKKPFTNVNVPDLNGLLKAATVPTNANTLTGSSSSSMGTVSAGVDVIPPPSNLFE